MQIDFYGNERGKRRSGYTADELSVNDEILLRMEILEQTQRHGRRDRQRKHCMQQTTKTIIALFQTPLRPNKAENCEGICLIS